MPTARLSSKSQIVIPAELRRRLGVRPGDDLVLEWEEDRIVIRKPAQTPLDILAALPRDIWSGAADEIHRMRDEWDR